MELTSLQRRLFLYGLFVILYLTITLGAVRQNTNSERNFDDLGLPKRHRINNVNKNRDSYANRRQSDRLRSEKPNIILIITDDQDELLGQYNSF